MKILIYVENTIVDGAMNPIGAAVKKVTGWMEYGAEISYLTEKTKFMEVKAVKDKLKELVFPGEIVRSRQGNETFREVISSVEPNVLVSFGLENDLAKLNSDRKIHLINLVQVGIDNLPDKPDDLVVYGKKEEPVAEVKE